MNTLIIFCANYLIFFVGLGSAIAWLLAPKESKARMFVQIIIAGCLAYILSKVASSLHFDARPFVTEHVKPLIEHAPDNGFPSDHSLVAATLTTLIFMFNRKIAWGMLVATIFIGVARVLALIHSPLDILAGWILGVIGGLATYFAINWIFQTYLQKLPEKTKLNDKMKPDEHLDKKAS